MPSVAGIASHAKGILIEFVQAQGNQLSFALHLISLPVRACVCVWDDEAALMYGKPSLASLVCLLKT